MSSGREHKPRPHLSVSGNYSQHSYGYAEQYYTSITVTFIDVMSRDIGSMWQQLLFLSLVSSD